MRPLFTFFESRLDAFPPDRARAPAARGVWAFAWFYMRDAKPALLLMALLSAVIAAGEVALFGLLGRIVDGLSGADPATYLADNGTTLLVLAALVGFGLPLLDFLTNLVIHQTVLGNAPMSARWRMHRHLLGQTLTFFADEMAGRVSTKVMQSALAVREMLVSAADIFVFVGVYFISIIVLVASADLRLAIPLAVWVAAYALILTWFLPRLGTASEAQADARSDMTGRIVDSYTNIQTVKLFSHARREEAYAKEGMRGFLQTVYVQMRLVTAFRGLIYLANCLLVVGITALGIWLWARGTVSVGAVAVASALALRINGMSQWVMWELTGLFEQIGTAHDGLKLLSQPSTLTDAPDARELIVTEGAIAFDNVTFHYGKGTGVIDDLTLRISPGERVGLVGRSGAGKSTLVNLLLRFFDVEGGRILIDGQDISRVTQESLRAHIGMVTQDTSLLNRSIRDNIAYGRPDATLAEIRSAAARANALDFIDGLADIKGRTGMDAHVGERGVKLSGGQRQRIGIARIFLKNAPILVLDEATSALDSEVESAIQDALFALMDGKTVLSIAHRLSTLAALDRIVVMDAGRIVEQGTHDALIRAGGLYADLWERQSGGFLPAEAAE